MKFSENEKKFIKELVSFDFSTTNIGYSLFLESEEFFNTDEIALLRCRTWDNGMYKLYFTNDKTDRILNRNLLYKYVEIFQLINKLNENRLITIVTDGGKKGDCVFLSKYPNNEYIAFALSIPGQKYTLRDGFRIEEISTNGKWIIKNGERGCYVGTERESFTFNNDILALDHFLYGMIFISPELEKLAKDDFETYEEKTLNLAQQSLVESQESVKLAKNSLDETKTSVKLAKDSLEETRTSVQFAKDGLEETRTSVQLAKDSLEETRASVQLAKDSLEETRTSVQIAKDSLEETKKSVQLAKDSLKEAQNCVQLAEDSLKVSKWSNILSYWAIGISFLTAIGSIIVSIWAENNPDNVTVQNPPDTVITTSINKMNQDINNHIDVKYEETIKLLKSNKSQSKSK